MTTHPTRHDDDGDGLKGSELSILQAVRVRISMGISMGMSMGISMGIPMGMPMGTPMGLPMGMRSFPCLT